MCDSARADVSTMNHFDVYFATRQGKGRTQCFQEHGHLCDEIFHSLSARQKI